VNPNELFERLHLPVHSRLPAFAGATGWLNSEPLTPAVLHGKVVLVDFGTFTCINWIRTLPYIRAWHERYREHGLVTVGVQTPEFEIEHDTGRIEQALRDMQITYPVVIDNDFSIWDAFANQYWPALYIADAEGRIRHHHFGEGGYDKSERVIRQLLTDAGADTLPDGLASVDPQGLEAAADSHNVRSPETYVGLARSERFASPGGGTFDQPGLYTVPARPHLNEWALAGNWTLGREDAVLNEPNGGITYRFHARDLNLILAPPAENANVRFRVRLDGERPAAAHGLDVNEDGNGVVTQTRLYQLIRQTERIKDRLFEIEFLDAGVGALCFTFG
jgi:thiol-disulfide isomerase/thioredoxin